MSGAVTSDGTREKVGVILDGLEKALPQCSCNVDMPSLRSVMFQLIARATDVGVVSIEVGPGGEALALPGATTWAEASPKVKAGRMTLRVAP